MTFLPLQNSDYRSPVTITQDSDMNELPQGMPRGHEGEYVGQELCCLKWDF